ncbi:fimbrillin family protein [Segatella maculosa]|uniref:fimbrillin family protein n=1 Tax=Segatella maculosa TaxID=439703 RepID=UPI00035C4F87|nr:fimbrillin family protein [Segatella maculosa]
MEKMNFKNNILWPAVPLAVACLTVGFTLFSCADKDIETDDSNGKALVAFNVSETQDQAQAGAKAYGPISRAAFTRELAVQDLTPEDLTMQKLPVQGKAGAGLCLIETTVAGVPSQLKAEVSTRANITTMATLQHFSTTAFYGSSDATLEPWFYDKETKEDGTLVSPMYWDWFKNHACFYAVYPRPYSKLVLSPESHTGTPYVDFTVESDVKNQKDLMTACSGNVHSTIGTMSATAPRTDLTFRHALTAVRFKVGENLSYSKHITKVEIVGAKSKGKYTLPTDKDHTGAWDASSLSAPATFTLGGDGTVSVSTSEAVNNIIVGKPGDNYVFYMIPQTLTGVQARFYFDGATTPAITVSLPGKWKPGTTKTYALSQNTSTWQYELTVTPPAPAEYNANATGNYKIESYREDPVSHTKQAVPWEVVGYDTNGDGTFSMTEPLPSWFTSLTTTSGNGSITTTGETGVAHLVPEAASINKLAAMNAALKLNAKGSASDYYDLSTHDIKGNTTLRNTANCYIISHPGYYKIPLVYGNAIKNGGKNESAYQTGNTGPLILTHFKDHDNKDITDPWIEKTNSGANNGVNDAKVVWADEAGLVKFGATKIVHDAGSNAFVQFEVPADKIKNGNAVIAVMKNGTVVWSWHLWFIHDDALNTIACRNYQNKRYDFSEETLGWKYTVWSRTSYTSPRSIKVKVRQTKGQISPATRTEAVLTITQNPGNVRQGYNTLYQFGRKDAFPGTDATAEGSFTKNGGDNMSIQNGIRHPETFYTDGSSWMSNPPAGYSYYNLWSANNTTTGFNDEAVVKTIYDPCPAGFHMPASNAFTGFTRNGQNNGPMNVSGGWYNGWNFNNKISSPDATVYFPASGFRYYYNGSLGYVGSGGHYWSAVPVNTFRGCHLNFDSDFVYPQNHSRRSFGLSVRPVAEPKTRVTPKLPGSTEEDWSSNEDLDAGDIDI